MSPQGGHEDDEVRDVSPGNKLPVKATAHKRFFIDMITRDISLEACVLDLIDNSVDGATRAIEDAPATKRSKSPKPHPLSSGRSQYDGYKIDVTCSGSEFRINDNCGGIPVDIACDYAFTFGRDPTQHTGADTDAGIGIYGVGMKRALFKMGSEFEVASSTADDGFRMNIDVSMWAAKSDWNFELVTTKPSRPHTTINVTRLRQQVGVEFQNRAFHGRLMEAAGRTYAAFLDQGLELQINGMKVRAREFSFLHSRSFQPFHETYKESVSKASGKGKVDVDVEIWAGAASAPTHDRPSADEEEDASMWGWYVLCNNRVVLTADKTEKVGWGLSTFPQWHPQYNGFLGIVAFRSEEPYALPWTTTKNDIDVDSVVYRRIRAHMQGAARKYITYSRARRANLDEAKKVEREAKPIRPTEVGTRQPMRTPPVPGTTAGDVNILYQRPKRQVAKAAAALGDPSMSASQVGQQTFDYFYSNEVD